MSGSLDYCYYNFLCAHRAGALSDFNHVVSNLGYLLLGALFMLQVRRRRLRRKREPRHQVRRCSLPLRAPTQHARHALTLGVACRSTASRRTTGCCRRWAPA